MLQWITILLLLHSAAAHSAPREVATISGVVLDSLHNEPLVNARVRLSSGGRVAITHQDGHFSFDGVPPGSYDVIATHPLADSLGLALEARNVTVASASDVRVLLAVPGVVSLKHMFCGDSANQRGAVIRGRVTRAGARDVGGATVTLSWLNVDFVPDKSSALIPESTSATADSKGFYSFCGFSPDFEAAIRATTATDSTAFIPISLAWSETGILLRPLVLPAPGVATLSGVVRDSSGRRLSGATIDVMGRKGSVKTGDDGTFTLPDAPTGSQLVRARKLGYSARISAVDIEPPRRDSVSFTLDNPVPRLATVIVRGMLDKIGDKTGFTRRSKAGMGKYVTQADLAKDRTHCVIDDMRRANIYIPKGPGCSIRWSRNMMTGFRGVSSLQGLQRSPPRGEAVKMPVASSASAFSGAPCLSVFVDDFRETPGIANSDIELGWLDPKEVAGIEYYNPLTSSVRHGSGCYTILIWTLHYMGGTH